MAADYTHFIKAGQTPPAVGRDGTIDHNGAFEFPAPEGFPVSQALITALQNPALYPHPVDGFQLIETHISWVLLTGEYAYKIKKPMNFGFLDFTGLDQRRHFCNEELRLNQRLTDGLYLEVLPITGSVDAPQIGGEGEAIEYVLKMRQFPRGRCSTPCRPMVN